jgi:hypothetical protein
VVLAVLNDAVLRERERQRLEIEVRVERGARQKLQDQVTGLLLQNNSLRLALRKRNWRYTKIGAWLISTWYRIKLRRLND